ncbi:hypothetical protein THIOM_001037 [Candidatus Thiomargarita nelsonii]|uniref:Transposase n=1 Tax=Candidatus Thiomargarita nelsonii TaxID=1003181 RepID=A0A176S5A4_9GAMM|nr:hypothetical protein THIOM_001037 [Candidatus Thiomargarita nelsonii]
MDEKDFDNLRQRELEEGVQKGERNKALETARKMLAKGYDLAEIAELTGLSPDDLATL